MAGVSQMGGGAGAPPGEMPCLRVPHDTLRDGLPNMRAHVDLKHPVETIQETAHAKRVEEKRAMMTNLYGIALPAQMDIEAQILSKHRRLPGLPSSRFGLEIMSGDVDRFGFEDYLSNPADREEGPRTDVHSAMEARLQLNKFHMKR